MTSDPTQNASAERDDEAERHRRLRALFEAALEQPLPVRAVWLEAQTAEPALIQAVQRLLDADAMPGQLETPVEEMASRIGDQPTLMANNLIGQRIGGFRLLRSLGQGGMGAVFLGERDNAEFRQFAAIKLLRRGLLSPDEHKLFRRERKALAMLAHPNITHLIDGGVTDAGVPYLVMEYVDGEPITSYAVAHRLDLRARLALFLTVCRAAAAAHRRLIVHRDIKPSNILVTPSGEVKLLDFGIAKLLDDDEDTTHRTNVAALTRGYAAPEQYVGDPISTATDVYALGVLLHELLLGERPEQATQRASSRVRELATDPAALPTSTSALRSALRGDLDNILLKAMAPEPERRYGSAAELADDIERHLNAQPVNAHPPSAWYRTRKFVQRHRGGVLASLAFTVALIASLGIAAWQARVARIEARESQRQAARANAMRDFMFAAFAEAEPSIPRDGPASVVDAVRAAVVASEHPSTADARARIELRTRLGQVLQAQGDLAGARTLFGNTLTEAEDSAIAVEDPLSQELIYELANNAVLNGDYALARNAIDAALQNAGNQAPTHRVRLLSSSSILASKVRDSVRALADGRLALKHARQIGDEELLRKTLNDTAIVLLSTGSVAEAATIYEEVLLMNRQRFGAQHQKVAVVLAALARCYRRLGDLPRAEAAVREALAIDAKLYPGDHYRTAIHLNALTLVLRSKGDFTRALEAANEALRINRATLGDAHPETINSQYGVGALELMLETYARALPLLTDALERSARQFGNQHQDTAVVRAAYGYALEMHTGTGAGRNALEQAITDLASAAEVNVELLSAAIDQRVRVALQQHDYADAQLWLDRLTQHATPEATSQKNWLANVHVLRGQALLDANDVPAALVVLLQAGELIDAAPTVNPLLRVEQKLLHAQALQRSGDHRAAVAIAAAARKLMSALPFVPGRLRTIEASLLQL